MKYQIEWNDLHENIEAHPDPTGREWSFTFDNGSQIKGKVDVIEEGTVLRLITSGETHTITLLPGNQVGSPIRFLLNAELVELGVLDPVDLITREVSSSGPGSGLTIIESVMPGIVRKILVQEGDSVEAGQPLLLLEAMKMENEILAPEGGTVTRLHVSAGDTVAAGTKMAHIEKND